MKRVTLLLLGLSALLIGPGCKKDQEVGENSEKGVQTTVETKQSKEEEDGDVKVRVHTPAGDYNVDVKR